MIKEQLLAKRKFNVKVQLVFYGFLFVCLCLLVFFAAIVKYTGYVAVVMMMAIVLFSGLAILDAKKDREAIEDFTLYYGMNKIKNGSKNKKQRKI